MFRTLPQDGMPGCAGTPTKICEEQSPPCGATGAELVVTRHPGLVEFLVEEGLISADVKVPYSI